MADENKKSYTEDEHIAILSDRVAKETAELTAQRDELTSVRTELESKLDVAESAKVAAEQAALEAQQALEAFKAEVQEQREAAARKDERLAKVRESAAHLGDEFFEDENRVKRIVAMDEEGFSGYLADLQATAKVPAGASTTVPRETAMAGATAPGAAGAESAARGFFLRRYTPQEG